jgi:hypothetical protein
MIQAAGASNAGTRFRQIHFPATLSHVGSWALPPHVSSGTRRSHRTHGGRA